MDAWPGDYRTEPQPAENAKGKKQSKVQPRVLQHPTLDHGALHTATLRENDGKLGWAFLVDQNTNGRPRVCATTKLTKVFPMTRPPPLNAAKLTIRQQAEYGAIFLRTYHPDVDITEELIRDETTEDAQHLCENGLYDPFLGNIIEHVVQHDGGSKKNAFLAFPMGELNRELNISPFYHSRNTGSIFKPSIRSSYTFSTPIQQIISSIPVFGAGQQGTYLAVRTFGSTTLFRFKCPSAAKFNGDSILTPIVELSGTNLDNETVADFVPLSDGQAFAVTANGSLFRYDPGSQATERLRSCNGTNTDSFWRLAPGKKRDAWILANKQCVKLYDVRERATGADLITLCAPDEVITCIEGSQDDFMTRVATTSQVLWIDERYPGRPLLGIEHHRHFDRGLRINTMRFQGGPLTFLSSPRNNIITVYDVSRGDNQAIQVKHRPYCLPTISLNKSENSVLDAGLVFVRHPAVTDHTQITLFGLTSRGSIHQAGFCLMNATRDSLDDATNYQWSDEVAALNLHESGLVTDVGPLGWKEFGQADLKGAYESIFRGIFDDMEKGEEKCAEAVYDALETMPSFWQEDTGPIEHMLTTYDVAFRTGDEPSKLTRADFLTQSVLNSTRGFRALSQGRLPMDTLAKTAQWHRNLGSTFIRIDESLVDGRPIGDKFKQFNLVDEDSRSALSVKRENQAREQLSLDLALATDVYSAQPFARENDRESDFDLMERATEALSLDGEPPPVEYGYLRPNFTELTDGERSADGEALGVRLLLKEWTIGTDPRHYYYVDPYEASATEAPRVVPRRKHGVASHPAPAQAPTIRTHQPPTVMSSKVIPPTQDVSMRRSAFTAQSQDPGLSRHFAVPGSQPQFVSSQPPSQPSQDYLPSTQVLPGPFGGRPSAVKKKPMKKRLGGF
ncbi:hypothetical protein HGRIS_012815 [Hohenbuehelia grisea]|uniref:RRN6 K-rich C-terminal domain-containing protein n=1 Tax=Hohenbuehelia grisea TaxID=104357 RepID=A0ABR3ITN6_9AGAR